MPLDVLSISTATLSVEPVLKYFSVLSELVTLQLCEARSIEIEFSHRSLTAIKVSLLVNVD